MFRAGDSMAGKPDHYAKLAAKFEEYWAHGPAYVAWMAGCMLDRLELGPGDRVADIGCGTGLYSRGLAKLAGRVVCVDPSAEMLGRVADGESGAFETVCASIEDLVSGAHALPDDLYDAILLKEALHHVSDRDLALEWLAGTLAPGGRLLVVMLPPNLSYPLFGGALRR
jgi:ubiquinone/menaquinone biosynthesis C-methylase UbiE